LDALDISKLVGRRHVQVMVTFTSNKEDIRRTTQYLMGWSGGIHGKVFRLFLLYETNAQGDRFYGEEWDIPLDHIVEMKLLGSLEGPVSTMGEVGAL